MRRAGRCPRPQTERLRARVPQRLACGDARPSSRTSGAPRKLLAPIEKPSAIEVRESEDQDDADRQVGSDDAADDSERRDDPVVRPVDEVGQVVAARGRDATSASLPNGDPHGFEAAAEARRAHPRPAGMHCGFPTGRRGRRDVPAVRAALFGQPSPRSCLDAAFLRSHGAPLTQGTVVVLRNPSRCLSRCRDAHEGGSSE